MFPKSPQQFVHRSENRDPTTQTFIELLGSDSYTYVDSYSIVRQHQFRTMVWPSCTKPEYNLGLNQPLVEAEDAVRFQTLGYFPIFAHSQQDEVEWAYNWNETDGEDLNLQPSSQTASSFISNTELSDGRQALLVDPGSTGNLSGTPWVCRTAALACKSPLRPDGTRVQPRQYQRERPLSVSGVGKQAQQCTHDCEIPIAMTTTDGRSIRGTFLTPTVNGDSHLPALLGLKALIANGAILDTQNLTLAFCGKE